MKMLSRPSLNVKMVQALTILSALQLFSEGVPGAEGSGEPYGISRGVVEGAARAGSALNPQNQNDVDLRSGVPVPALSQVSPTAAPSPFHPSSSNSIFNGPITNRHGEAQKPEMPPCSVGPFGQGVLRFERIADHHLARPNRDILRRSEIPGNVLFTCQDLCLKNTTGHNQRQFCSSIDFVPGEKRPNQMSYTESQCLLSTPTETPGQLPQYRHAKDHYHYREVCYGGGGTDKPTVATDCPERLYVMERILNKKFMPPGAREVRANTLEMCQQMCLNQAFDDHPLRTTSICRAGTFDYQNSRCYLSTFTRRTQPNELLDDQNYSYFENTCLDVERRCPENKLIWTLEKRKELAGPYDTLVYSNVTLKECQERCLDNKNILCRSIEYDERDKTCVLSDEDSVSRPQDVRETHSEQNLLLELKCIYRKYDEPENHLGRPPGPNRDRQPLSNRDLRDVYTAFQLIRNRVLELSPGFRERGREGRDVSLAECLDQCLEERSFPCRSATYSPLSRICRLSEHDRINGKLVHDNEFQYYENLMGGSAHVDRNRDSFEDSSQGFRRPSLFGNNRVSTDFQGGSSFDRNRFDRNRFGFDRGFSSDRRFSTSSGTRPFNNFDSKEDRFSDAFNRFHESSFNRGGSRGSQDRFSSTNRFEDSERRLTGTFGSRGSGVDNRRPVINRWAPTGSDSSRFDDDRKFGTVRDRFSDDRRFDSGFVDRTRESGGFFSSGADVASLRPSSTRGGSSRFDSERNRFHSGGGFSSFGFGSGSGASSFGASSSSDFGFGGAGNTIDRFRPSSSSDILLEGHDERSRFPRPGVGLRPTDFDYDQRPLPPPKPPVVGGGGLFPGYRPPFDDRRPDFGSRPDYRPPRPDLDFGNTIFGSRPPLPRPGYDSGFGSGFGSGEIDSFDPVGFEKRLKYEYIKRVRSVRSVNECKDMCLKERTFTCRSFNYRYAVYEQDRNCELSDMNLSQLDLRNPSHFEPNHQYDYYERSRRTGGGPDVSQQCNTDGSMEFMLRTEEPFRGRIYAFGYYDRCFYRGGGSTVNVLKISPPRNFPDCGTIRYGDTTTNIIVVQFADGVMTARDKRYNLTCTTIGPGDTVVTSDYIGAGVGAPIPIEYLPEESRLDSQVRLQILYHGRPTTTVAVGDPLTFRIESLAGRGLITDIFATDVIARDILTGRAIELIDSRGCPVQEDIFPALGRARTGDGLEARFSAFKMPETNMLSFEARVRTCNGECQPARCTSNFGRAEQLSMGKKRRRRSAADEDHHEYDTRDELLGGSPNEEIHTFAPPFHPSPDPISSSTMPPPPAPPSEYEEELENLENEISEKEPNAEFGKEEAKLNEVIRVYLYEDEAEEHRSVETAALTQVDVCVTPSEYYSLLTGLMITGICLLASLAAMGFCYRRQRKLQEKNAIADDSNPRQPHRRAAFPGAHARTVNQPARKVAKLQRRYFPSHDEKSRSSFDIDGRTERSNRFADPSEPIYTDPTLFERSPNTEMHSSSSVKL